MPKKLTDCVKKVKEKGMPEKSAWPICVSSTGEKPHKKSFDDYVVNQISKGRKDIISGGIGDKTQPKDVDKKQLDMGVKVEKEHTTNKKIAKEIALDHLTEDKKYYSKLAVMEGKGGKSSMVKKSIEDRINSLYKAPIVNKDTQSFTDIADMSLAKLSTPASLQSLLAENVRDLGIGETKVIPLDNGKSLKIYRVEEGIYSGHILEEDGSISHNIDRSTIPEIAAHLVVKNAGNEEAEENEEAEIEEKTENEIENGKENGKENETEIKQENEGNKLVINININKAKNMNLDEKINSLYKAFDPMKFKKKNKKDEDEEDIDEKDNKDGEDSEENDEDIQEINTPPKEDEEDEDTEGEDGESEEDEEFGDDNEDPENEFKKKNEGDETDNDNEDDGQNDSPDLQGNPSQYQNEPSKPEKVELKQEGDADAHSNITYPEGYTPGASEHDSVEEQADNGIAPQGQQPQVDENGNPVLTPNKKKLISHLLDIAKQHHDGDDSDSVNDISKFLVHLHRGDNNQEQTGHTQQPIKKSKVAQSLSKGDIKLTNEENKLIFDVAVKDMLTSAYLYCKFRHPEFSRKEIMSKIANKAISDIARKMQWDEKFVLAKRAVKFDEKYLLDLIKQLDLDEIDESIANRKTAPEEMFYSTEGRQVFGMRTKSSTKMIDVLEKGNNFFGKPIQSKTLNVKFKEVDYCELAKGKIEKKTDVMMKSHIEKLFKK